MGRPKRIRLTIWLAVPAQPILEGGTDGLTDST